MFLKKKDVDVLSTVNDRFYSSDDVINYQNGFNIAVAFSAFDSNPEPLLDQSYGELVFKHYFWGHREDGSYGSDRELINSSHNCT